MTAKAPPGRVEIIRHYFSRSSSSRGGVCVYAKHEKGDSYFTVSTAVCSTGDQYNRKLGKTLAINTPGIKIPINAFNCYRPSGERLSKNNLSRDDLLDMVEALFYETFSVYF